MEKPQAKIVWSDNGKDNYDTRVKYRIIRDKYGLYEIFKEVGSVDRSGIIHTTWSINPFASGIHIDLIYDVIDEYERGIWCDICKCDGIIEDDNGYVYVCENCIN